MEASEYLINCLKMSRINKNASNTKQDIEEITEENTAESFALNEDLDKALIVKLIEDIKIKEEMDKALYELSKHRENLKDLAVYIYYSTGTMAIL
jgi:regulator of replication initiation timing